MMTVNCEKEPLITVIIPVYNVEKYIDKCIRSIICQDYSNLEIILVDDGATDSSGQICDNYSKEDDRIQVIHKINGGLSDARNAALDIMTGEYVVFIDSDDYIEKNYISYLYYLIRKYKAQISICNFKYVTEAGTLINKEYNSGVEKEFSQKDALVELLSGKEINTSASMKLYKADLFLDIRYPKGKLYEDISTTYKTFLKSDKMVYGDMSLYIYLCRDGSITKQTFSIKRMDAIENLKEMCGDIECAYPELKKYCRCRLFSQYISVYLVLKKSRFSIELEKQLFKEIRKMKNCVKCNRKEKVYGIMSGIGKLPFDICIVLENCIQTRRRKQKINH